MDDLGMCADKLTAVDLHWMIMRLESFPINDDIQLTGSIPATQFGVSLWTDSRRLGPYDHVNVDGM